MVKTWAGLGAALGLLLAGGGAVGEPIDPSAPAWVRALDAGDWVLVATDDNLAVFFGETEPPRETMGWERIEQREARQVAGHTVASMRVLMEFDCPQNRMATRQVVLYPQRNMGGAATTVDVPTPEWDPIEAGTNGEALFRWACHLDAGR